MCESDWRSVVNPTGLARQVGAVDAIFAANTTNAIIAVRAVVTLDAVLAVVTLDAIIAVRAVLAIDTILAIPAVDAARAVNVCHWATRQPYQFKR